MIQIELSNNKEYLLLKVTGDSWSDIQEDIESLSIIPIVTFDKYSYKSHIAYVEDFAELLAWLDFKGLEYTHSLDIPIKYHRETEFFRNSEFDDSIFNDNIKPYKYQLELLKWQIKRNRFYNTGEPGIGKSFLTIATISHWFKKQLIDSIILVVQNGSLLYHWKKEILLFSNVFKETDIEILHNTTKVKPFEKLKDKKIIIIPDHLFSKVLYSYRPDSHKVKQSKNIKWKTWCNVPEVWDKKSIAIVLDEAHGFKNPKSQKYKSLEKHIEFFKFRIMLSATPAINGFEDWLSQLYLLDKGILEVHPTVAYIKIADSIGNSKNPLAINKYNTYEIDKIKEQLKFNVISRKKSELEEMKTKQIIDTVYFEMTELQKQIYHRVFEEENIQRIHLKGNKVEIKQILAKFPYTLQVIDNPLLLKNKLIHNDINKLLEKWKFENDNRIKWLDIYLKEQIETLNKKVVIFDTHPLTIELLAKHYSNYFPLKLISGTTAEEKAKIVDQFNDLSDKHKLIICSYQVASTGINLQKGSNILVLYTLPQDVTLYRQALDRTYRITSIHDSIVKCCVIDNTFDIIRYRRCINRTELNDNYINSYLSVEELDKLLLGIL